MLQASDRARFVQKGIQRSRRRRVLRANEFHSYFAVEELVVGLEHNTHTARAKLSRDFIALVEDEIRKTTCHESPPLKLRDLFKYYIRYTAIVYQGTTPRKPPA